MYGISIGHPHIPGLISYVSLELYIGIHDLLVLYRTKEF